MGTRGGSGGGGKGGGGSQQGGGEPEGATLENEAGPGVSAGALEAAREGEASATEGGRIEELLAEVAALRKELADARAAAEKAGRRGAIERALAEAGAIDLEITTPLVEEVMGTDEGIDVGKAVRAVRASKGFLFRGGGGAGGGKGSVMAGVSSGDGIGLEDLAGDARGSGDRSDLLRYLRARRG